MEYELIATLGPASQGETMWGAMLAAGASGFRLNTSHLSLEQIHAWLERLERFVAQQPAPIPMTLDLQGSKWRLGEFPAADLAEGQPVELILAATAHRAGALPVPHPDFFEAAAVSGPEISLNDARCRLRVKTAGADWVRAKVIQGGPVGPNKGITFTASNYRQERLSEKDQAILGQTSGLGFVRYAISYVRDAAEMQRFRALAGPAAHLTAKLERQLALDEAAQIAALADALWLCRGDLGAELGLPDMAEQVSRFSARVREYPCPVFLAGQVLEHLTAAPTPTRSEVCYLYEALQRGYAGFVLSDETAIGRYPVESCRAARMFGGGE